MTWLPGTLTVTPCADSDDLDLTLRGAEDIAVATVKAAPVTLASGDPDTRPDWGNAWLLAAAPDLEAAAACALAALSQPATLPADVATARFVLRRALDMARRGDPCREVTP